MKIIIITGASSGMGREFAVQMDSLFPSVDEFWLIARREEKMLELAKTLRHNCRIFGMDVTEESASEELIKQLRRFQAKVCVMVNCAGYGLMGSFAEALPTETVGMIQTNCEALTRLTHCVIPFMARNGRIIQLASSAAFVPQADFAVYAASKSYVLSFSRALARELSDRAIHVTAVCPGPVETPFFEVAEKYGSTLAMKKIVMAKPEKVVEKALLDSYHKREISVYGKTMQLFEVTCKVLPHGVIMGMTKLLKDLQNRQR